MKRLIFVLSAVILAMPNPALSAQIVFSGVLDSTVSMQAGDLADFSGGMEQFANIRFQSRFRDNGRMEGAVNLFAATGNYAVGPAAMGTASIGENYVAGIELERLFFRLNFESFDLDGGLMRMPFGYSRVWGSVDFLNPPNVLNPTARPRGVLGYMLTWHAAENFKLAGFGVAPKNPLVQDGSGGLTGISSEWNWDAASMQALYAFELPDEIANNGIHRMGISLKADIEANFIIDALYTYNPQVNTEWDYATKFPAHGLSFSAGVEYSFFDGNLFILAEYLYNGAASSTALGYGGFLSNEHYLSTSFNWHFVDFFTNVSLTLISGLSDMSFIPVLGVNYELFQGALLIFTIQVPIDQDLPSDFSARLRLRF